ncbi:MAG: hypothetical protein J7M34_04000 [Anaerolineae bacterium]|nr:hypothetical protein [Anaerolineae bacterium]
MQSVSAGFTTATQAAVRQPVSKLEISWDGSSWTDETDRMIRHSGQLQLNAPGDELIPPGDVGAATVELWNGDGRFSWKRTDGPLYAHIGGDAGLAGKQVRLYQGFMVSGAPEYVRIFTGVIYTWQEDTAADTVTLSLRDMGFAYLQNKASTAMYTDVRVDEWIQQLATLAGIGSVSLDTSLFRLPYAWLDDESILEEIWRAAQADGGRAYFDQLGVLRFENAAHWLTSPHDTVQWSFTESAYQAPASRFSPDDLASRVIVETQGRIPAKEAVVYTLDTLKVAGPGETITFECRLNQPAALVWTPEAGKDYQAISPGGLDMNGDVIISVTKYAQRVQVRLANNHATMPAQLIFFQLRGVPLIGGPTEEVIQEAASPPAGLERTRSVRANQYLQMHAQADALASLLRDRHQALMPEWELRGVAGVPQLELGDRVSFVDSQAISGVREGFVIGIRWTYDGYFSQDLVILDAENLFPYTDYFVIGQTALGAHGRAWY